MRCLQGLFGVFVIQGYTAKKMRAFRDQLGMRFVFFGEGKKVSRYLYAYDINYNWLQYQRINLAFYHSLLYRLWQE